MNTVLIVLAVLVVLVLVALAVATPRIRQRQAGASDHVRTLLGGEDAVIRLDHLANAFGSEPATGTDLRGPGTLGLGATRLVFALTADQTMVIERNDIVGAESTAEPSQKGKAMLKVTWRGQGGEVTSSWRLTDAAGWVEALNRPA